jgi:hypothetical protein
MDNIPACFNVLLQHSPEELTRQAMYVERNIEGCSRKHYWSGTAINITFPQCLSLALFIQHAT